VFDTSGESSVGSLSQFDDRLQQFLAAGDAAIYFGWGSMCRENNQDLVRAAASACKLLGRRGILLRGWAHLSLDMLDEEADAEIIAYAKNNILVVDKVNHLRLFPKCACVVAHAGAGTAACMFRGGKPCIITPVWWDQNFMGDRAEVMGCGLRGPHFSKITGANLAPLISRVLNEPSFATQAASVREAILSKPSGDIAIAEKVHQQISSRRMCQQHGSPKQAASVDATTSVLSPSHGGA